MVPTSSLNAVAATALPLPESAEFDVAIVGFGPSGATLANLLALQGHKVLVLDREATVHRLPRAVHLDAETMRILQTAGIASDLADHTLVAPGVRFVNGEGMDLHVRHRPPEPGDQGWHTAYRVHQPGLEQLLRDRLGHRTGVTTRLRCDVFAVEQTAEHVVMRFEETGSGRIRAARARYVVGCDGARSTVRRFMQVELEDLRSHERWLVVDVLLQRPRPDLGDYGIQFCDPARPSTYIRGVGDRRRWEFMLMPGEDAERMAQPEVIWGLLARWLTPEDAVLERPAVYTFHSVVARGWRRGRLLLAGDAAHQTPPFLGQGMCAGIRDASNLAWKLAAVLRGQANGALLDTYESERAPHVRELIEAAVRIGRVIQTTNPEEARQRDIDLAQHPETFSPPEPALGPGAHDGAPDAGCIGRQPRLDDGVLLDDRVGYRHVLLVREDARAAAMAAVQDHDVEVLAEGKAVQAWLTKLHVDALLLRPDRYVAGVARGVDDIAALVQRCLAFARPGDPGDTRPALRFTHFGIYAKDLARMERFYAGRLGFTVTDRGRLSGPNGDIDLVFMSRDPDEHHQIVLVSGRPEEVAFNVINQISFKCADLATLREMLRRMQAEGARDIAPRTHGNAVSVYARDPEGNRLEFYVDLPWYVAQPVGVPADFSLDDAALLAALEAHARSLPGFRSRAQWREDMARRMTIGATDAA